MSHGSEAVSRIMVLLSAGCVAFAGGTVALIAQLKDLLVGAQVDNSLLVGLAIVAITTATAFFAWIVKLLLESRENDASIMARLKALEDRMNRWED